MPFAPPPCKVLKPSITAAITMKTDPHNLADIHRTCALQLTKEHLPQRIPTSAFGVPHWETQLPDDIADRKHFQSIRHAHNGTGQNSPTRSGALSPSSRRDVTRSLQQRRNVHSRLNTPATIQSEIATGEKPAFTSFVGASAAPSHIPAVKPHSTPSLCNALPADLRLYLPLSLSMQFYRTENAVLPP